MNEDLEQHKVQPDEGIMRVSTKRKTQLKPKRSENPAQLFNINIFLVSHSKDPTESSGCLCCCCPCFRKKKVCKQYFAAQLKIPCNRDHLSGSQTQS